MADFLVLRFRGNPKSSYRPHLSPCLILLYAWTYRSLSRSLVRSDLKLRHARSPRRLSAPWQIRLCSADQEASQIATRRAAIPEQNQEGKIEKQSQDLKGTGRYDASGLIEAQFEPGSRGRVLRNLLGIKGKREMDQIEAREQLRALEELIGIYDQDHRFSANDICRIHRIWLKPIYAWAGQYRQVNLSKGGFPFAAADQIPRLMMEFERGPLQQSAPCRFHALDEVISAIAIVHAEFLLIHPFREGNGRVARLLAILMALQAGLPPLDFGGVRGRKRQEYFAAVKAGLERNYQPMEKVFSAVIRRTLRAYGG